MFRSLIIRFYRRLPDLIAAGPDHLAQVDGLIATNAFGKCYDLRDRMTCHAALSISDGDRVLDAGGGHNPLFRANVVVDIDAGESQHRNFNTLRLHPHQTFVQAPLEDLSAFKDKEFDYVFCSQVLEHVEDPAKACAELQRVAKRGFVDTPRSGMDLVVSHPEHRWLIDWIDGTLYFRPKPARIMASPVYRNYGLAAWYADHDVQERTEFWFRNVSNNHFEWNDGFDFKVLRSW